MTSSRRSSNSSAAPGHPGDRDFAAPGQRLTISLINEGQIFRFLLAPPGRELLRRCLVSAFERHVQLRSLPDLMARHEVEESRTPQASISGRLLDYWRRLREGVRRAS